MKIVRQLAASKAIRMWNQLVEAALLNQSVDIPVIILGTGAQKDIDEACVKHGFWVGKDVPNRQSVMQNLFELRRDLVDLGVIAA